MHYDARHDVSLPLRDMARTAPKARTRIEMPEPGHKRLLPAGPPGADTAVYPGLLSIRNLPLVWEVKRS